MEQTLAIIKPDAVRRNLIGAILNLIEKGGLRVVAGKLSQLTPAQAASFYAVHKERPFFGELCATMTSGPVFICALEGHDAVARYRKLMGATNPAQAEAGTIRALHALNIGENSVHGSDSVENAKNEIAHFFSVCDIVS